jgi:serine/threonine protein kinase
VISDTLARLQRDFDVAHRDVKPGNLYELEGDWLIGDFGLIALPGAEPLTGEGRQVGPAHYTAYEMIINPSEADPHPADVYSLGKTLWVLATGQAFPPEGNQPTGSNARGFTIGDFRPHPQAALLDREVDLMTRLIPTERPRKHQVAIDLAAWLELASEPVLLDVSDAKSRLQAKIATAISMQDVIERNKDFAHQAVRRLQALTAPLNAGLKELYERTQVDISTDEMTQNLLKTHRPNYPRSVEFRWQRCTIIAPFKLPGGVVLRMSRSLELFNDGILALHLMVHVGPQGVSGSDFHWQSSQNIAPVGSLEAEKMLDHGIQELTEALKQGVEVFVDRLPEVGPP